MSDKKRLDLQPTVPAPDFDVGVYATRLLRFTRKMVRDGGFPKRAKHDGDVLAVMGSSREILHLAHRANEMPQKTHRAERVKLIRELIGELDYYESLLFSFWEENYISGDQWCDWEKQARILKGKAISWYNKMAQ